MSVTTVSSSMITDATILNADIGAAAAIATTKLGAGAIVQVVNTLVDARSTTTQRFTNDDTIPQNSEMTEVMSLAITPTSSSNKLLIEATVVMNNDLATRLMIGLFNTDHHATNAVAVIPEWQITANTGLTNTFSHYMTAPSASATTYRIYIATDAAATLHFNGQSSTDKFGGVMYSSITITEIAV